MPLCLQCFRLNSPSCVISGFQVPFYLGVSRQLCSLSAEALSWDPGLRGQRWASVGICRASAGDCPAACGIGKGQAASEAGVGRSRSPKAQQGRPSPPPTQG